MSEQYAPYQIRCFLHILFSHDEMTFLSPLILSPRYERISVSPSPHNKSSIFCFTDMIRLTSGPRFILLWMR